MSDVTFPDATTPPTLARQLETTGKLLATRGQSITALVDLWSISTGGGNGPGQKGAVSRPTQHNALALAAMHRCEPYNEHCERCVAALAGRWHLAQRTIRSVSQDVMGNAAKGLPTASLCRLLAHLTARIPGPGRHRLNRACLDLAAIADEATPLTIEQAQALLAKRAVLARRAECCQACESPTGESTDPKIPSTRIVSGLCKPGCHEMEDSQMRRGRYIDRPTFIAQVQADVTRGILHRPASPLWRTAVPTIHEGDDAA